MNKTLVIVIIGIVLAFIFASCKQTDEDINHESMLIGDWYAIDNNGDTLESYNVPQYHFDTANNGFSWNENSTDDFKWEVRRGQIKIFYETAPAYYIGYDKYNSQSLMRIVEVSENWFEVTQFYSDGFQSDLSFNRIVED